jgi:hypothetical protein
MIVCCSMNVLIANDENYDTRFIGIFHVEITFQLILLKHQNKRKIMKAKIFLLNHRIILCHLLLFLNVSTAILNTNHDTLENIDITHTAIEYNTNYVYSRNGSPPSTFFK